MRKLAPKLFLLLWLTVAVPCGAQAITLDKLFDNGSITAGDKLFDEWSLLNYSAGDMRSFNAANIDVTPLNDGGLNPGPGLNFSVSNSELDVTGNGVYNYVNLTFSFRVSVLDPLLQIKDVSLELNSGFLIYTMDESYDLGISIQETIGSTAGAGDLATTFAKFSILNGDFTNVIKNSVDFSPLSEIWITKDILVWAVDETDSASCTGFEQRFSQEVIPTPEPSIVVLMLLGLSGLVAVGRRKLT